MNEEELLALLAEMEGLEGGAQGPPVEEGMGLGGLLLGLGAGTGAYVGASPYRRAYAGGLFNKKQRGPLREAAKMGREAEGLGLFGEAKKKRRLSTATALGKLAKKGDMADRGLTELAAKLSKAAKVTPLLSKILGPAGLAFDAYWLIKYLYDKNVTEPVADAGAMVTARDNLSALGRQGAAESAADANASFIDYLAQTDRANPPDLMEILSRHDMGPLLQAGQAPPRPSMQQAMGMLGGI